MNKIEFLQRFLLQPLKANNSTGKQNQWAEQNTLIDSAVLVVLSQQTEQLQVLLTKRASHLKHHPGQISFPGGKVDTSDQNHIATALREAYEEVGLSCKSLTILGKLNNYQTLSGFNITPIIALQKQATHYQINNNEVDQVFHVPLQYFLHQDKFTLTVERRQRKHHIYFIPYKEHNIWGATAAIINDLSNFLK